MQPVWLCIPLDKQFQEHLKILRRIFFGQSNLCDFASSLDGNFLCSKFGDTLETNSGEMSKKMQSVWLCIPLDSQFEYFIIHSGKVEKMQPLCLCILSCKQFEEAIKNTQWRKVKWKKPVWLYTFTGRQFKYTFENAHWGKVKNTQPVWLCIWEHSW